jgi:hypothetical protein
VLLGNGLLLYYKSSAELPAELKGSLLLSAGSTVSLLPGADFALAAAADGAGFGEKPALLLRAAGASVRGALVETLAALVPELRVLQPPAELPALAAGQSQWNLGDDEASVQMTPAAASSHDALRKASRVLRASFLEKKGGVTKVGPDGKVLKERNFGKGGRRNWQRRWFVLLESGHFLWYGSEDEENEEGLKGQIHLKGCTLYILANNELIMAPSSSSDDGSKESLNIRSDDSYELSLYMHHFQMVDPGLQIVRHESAGLSGDTTS